MKTLIRDSHRSYLAALLSLLFHLPLLTLAPPQKGSAPPSPLEVERITPEQLKRYRNVGIKNGSRQFSVPIPLPRPHSSPPNLQSLRPQPVAPPPSRTERTPLPPLSPSIPPKLKVMASRPSDTSFLQQTGFNIQFDPPEGVSEDELNDAEKTFWSFKKRVYQTYVSSVLSTYNRLLLARPQLKRKLQNARKHRMAGKMVFDGKGNILKIKIIRASDQDELQTLFEQSLRNIHKIPNPPQGLLSKEEKLTLYYELIINGR